MKKSTSQLGIEEFLLYYNKAYRKGNIDALYQLSERYPDLVNQACQLALSHHQDPSDEEFLIPHPIVLSSAYFTERRVLDMVAYLLCKPAAPKSAYSARTAHPFQRNGAPFRFKLSKAQQVD